MPDWFVLLTPIVALAVIALLGFSGCDLVFGLAELRTFILRVKVPTTLTVTVVRFKWKSPHDSATSEVATDDAQVTIASYPSEDGAFTIFEHSLSRDADEFNGDWYLLCRVTVTDATGAGADTNEQMAVTITDDPPAPAAFWTAKGSPAGGNFRVAWDPMIVPA